MHKILAPLLLQGMLLYPYGYEPRTTNERWDQTNDIISEMRRLERERRDNDMARDIIRGWDEEARERRRQSYQPYEPEPRGWR